MSKNVSVEWDGEKYTRARLIEYIENNDLQKELKKRMVQKWEELEASVRTNRPPKYH